MGKLAVLLEIKFFLVVLRARLFAVPFFMCTFASVFKRGLPRASLQRRDDVTIRRLTQIIIILL